MRGPSHSIPVLLPLLLAAACTPESGDDTTGGNGLDGETIFRSPVEDGNSFTCDTCHALTEPAADGLRRPGHPLGDATGRPTYKLGQLTEMRLAVASCLTEWMNAEPWEADDERWIALDAFLREQAPDSAPELVYDRVDPPADLSGGDPVAGQAVFNQSCAVCHGADGVGTNKALPVAGRGLDPAYVAQRVRTSGGKDSPIYPGLTGGIMPFWAADRLSDQELRDIVAWLEIDDGGGTTGGTGTGGSTTGGTGTDGTTSDGTATTGSGCGTDHPRVGWVANLSMEFHGVSGQAEIVDNCTVVISDFNYDGAGIDVRIYGGVGGDYDNGYPMTGDLVKSGGYTNDTLVASLPMDRTLDDLDGISVWCVDVGVSFGEGMFAAP